MSNLRISAIGDEPWNATTYVVFALLVLLFGWLVESFFGTWSWAMSMVGLGAGASEEVPRGRGGSGAVTIIMWLVVLVPLLMTVVPALGSLVGLSVLTNRGGSTSKRRR